MGNMLARDCATSDGHSWAWGGWFASMGLLISCIINPRALLASQRDEEMTG